MRFASRLLIGVAAAATVAVAAPAAAGATTTAGTTAASAKAGAYFDNWGPYFSADHKAKAAGYVKVTKKSYKEWHWKTFWVTKKVCKWHNGKKKCWWDKDKVKKKVWVWKHAYHFDVHGKLHNYKPWGKNKCSWANFKIVSTDGDTRFESVRNCDKGPRHFSFSGKDAAHIYVNVSRGNPYSPKGWHSGWQDVYHAV